MVIPGLVLTSASASAPRVPLPFGRPRRPLPVAPRLRGAAGARRAEPASAGGVSVTVASADAAASRRSYSSTSGLSSFSRASISCRFSSRKSADGMYVSPYRQWTVTGKQRSRPHPLVHRILVGRAFPLPARGLRASAQLERPRRQRLSCAEAPELGDTAANGSTQGEHGRDRRQRRRTP